MIQGFFSWWELLSSSHVLVLDYVQLFYNLPHERVIVIVPTPHNDFFHHINAFLMQVLHLDSFLFLKVKTDFPAPLNLIRLNLPVVEIPLLNVVHAVPTARWWHLWFAVVLPLVVGFNRFFVLLLLLDLCYMLLLSHTIIRHINAMMVEKLTEWREICRVHKRTKTTAHCMRVYPLVILSPKRFLRKLSKKILILLFHPLKLRPLLLKVSSF